MVLRLNLKDDLQAYYDFSKLIFITLFTAHLCGCTFYSFHLIELNFGIQDTWVYHHGQQHFEWWELYINCLYFSIITMITVGYGDIYPVNAYEKMFVIIITLITCGIFAYSINQIGQIVQDLTWKQAKFNRKMILLTNYMKDRHIKNKLQLKVKKYYEYLELEQSQDHQIGLDIKQQLVKSLKDELYSDIYGKIIREQKIFKLNFSDTLLDQLAQKIEEIQFSPQQVIYNVNDQQDQIYFLIKGNVDEFIEKKLTKNAEGIEKVAINQVVKRLKDKDIFNQMAFFSGKTCQTGAITNNIVTVGILTKKDFLKIIKQFPKDYQKYKQLVENLCVNSQTRGLGIQCQICSNFNHYLGKCQYVQYVPNKQQIIHKYEKQTQNQIDRVQFQRNNEYRTINTLLNIQIITEELIQYLIETSNDQEQLLQQLYFIQKTKTFYQGASEESFCNQIDNLISDQNLIESDDINQYINNSNNNFSKRKKKNQKNNTATLSYISNNKNVDSPFQIKSSQYLNNYNSKNNISKDQLFTDYFNESKNQTPLKRSSTKQNSILDQMKNIAKNRRRSTMLVNNKKDSQGKNTIIQQNQNTRDDDKCSINIQEYSEENNSSSESINNNTNQSEIQTQKSLQNDAKINFNINNNFKIQTPLQEVKEYNQEISQKSSSQLIQEQIKQNQEMYSYQFSSLSNKKSSSQNIISVYSNLSPNSNQQIENSKGHQENHGYCEFIKLILIILLSAHFCGCLFFAFHRIEVSFNEQLTWISNLHIQDSLYKQYITSLYFSIITMITIGYGDIHPVNANERLVIIIITLISCGIFAYSVNQIGSIISDMTWKKTQFNRKMVQFSNYLKDKHLSHNLQIKVKQYYEHLELESQEDTAIKNIIQNQLVGHLKNEVYQELYGKLLKKEKLFYLNFSQKFLNQLALHMQEQQLGPQEIIYNDNQNNQDLYFIVKGNVNQYISQNSDQTNQQYYQEDQIKVINKVGQNNMLNQMSFLSGQRSKIGAITIDSVTIVILKKNDFLQIIKNFSQDFQKFQQFSENYNMQQVMRGLGFQCQACGKYSHLFYQCEQIKYYPNKIQVINKYENIQQQIFERKKIQRKNEYRSINSKLNNDLIREEAIQYLIDNQILTQDNLLKKIYSVQKAHKNYLQYTKFLQLQQKIKFKTNPQHNAYQGKVQNRRESIFSVNRQSDINILNQDIYGNLELQNSILMNEILVDNQQQKKGMNDSKKHQSDTELNQFKPQAARRKSSFMLRNYNGQGGLQQLILQQYQNQMQINNNNKPQKDMDFKIIQSSVLSNSDLDNDLEYSTKSKGGNLDSKDTNKHLISPTKIQNKNQKIQQYAQNINQIQKQQQYFFGQSIITEEEIYSENNQSAYNDIERNTRQGYRHLSNLSNNSYCQNFYSPKKISINELQDYFSENNEGNDIQIEDDDINNHNKKDQQQFTKINIDKMCLWDNFFVNNNYNKVLEKYNKLFKKRLKNEKENKLQNEVNQMIKQRKNQSPKKKTFINNETGRKTIMRSNSKIFLGSASNLDSQIGDQDFEQNNLKKSQYYKINDNIKESEILNNQ